MEDGGRMPPVGGPEAAPTERELALISAAVYDPDVEVVGRWRRVKDCDLPSRIAPHLLEDTRSGFRAGIYTNGESHVLAFAGTKGVKDVFDDIKQGLGAPSTQYTQAEQLSRLAKLSFPRKLTLTGHSLGGGLANLAAIVADTPAVTFNAAGVHRKTYERAGLDADKAREIADAGLVRAVFVSGEFLTRSQDATALPRASGVRIEVDPVMQGSGVVSTLPFSGLARSFRSHRIGSVIAAMANDRRFGDVGSGLASVMQDHVTGYLKESGMSEKSVVLVSKALARKIELEAKAGRFPPKVPSKDLGRSR